MATDKKDAAQQKRHADFRRRLKTRKEQLGLTQMELAKAIGRTQGTVSDYFNEVAALPDGDAMMLLPVALKCSGHWLLTGLGPMNPPTATAKDLELRAFGAHDAIGRIRELIEDVAHEYNNHRPR